MDPLVTILLPVRNGEATLDACLASIATQTLENFELVIVDDNSTDQSASIAARHAAADARVRLLRNPSRGLVAALNFGVQQARSELIARMDADDLMLPERLALQHERMTRQPAVAVLGTRVAKFPEVSDGYREYLRWQNSCLSADDIASEIFVESPFAHPSVMFRGSVISAGGGYRHGDFPEDYELWLRLHAQGSRMEKLPEVLLRWRDTPQRLSRQDSRYRRAAFDHVRAAYLSRDSRLLQHARSFAIWGAGRRTRQRCTGLLQRGFNPCAWIDIDPRKIGNRLNGVPVVSPDWLLENRVFVLGYVANHGARDDIAQWLSRHGFQRGENFLMVG